MFNYTNVVFELFVIVGHWSILVLPVFVQAPLAVAYGMRWVLYWLEVEHHDINVPHQYGFPALVYFGMVSQLLLFWIYPLWVIMPSAYCPQWCLDFLRMKLYFTNIWLDSPGLCARNYLVLFLGYCQIDACHFYIALFIWPFILNLDRMKTPISLVVIVNLFAVSLE